MGKILKYVIILSSFFVLTQSVFADQSNININNVNHKFLGNSVEITRDSSAGDEKIDLFLRDSQSKTFHYITQIDVFSQSYTLYIDKPGQYVLKFVPSQGGSEIRHTFIITLEDLGGEEAIQKDKIENVPKTGPTETVLIIIFGSLLLYLIYRYTHLTRK